MNIISVTFKYYNNKLYCIVEYDDGQIKKYYVKFKHRESLLNLLIDITVLQ